MEALVIIDVQNDFCPGGRLAVPGGDEIVPIINELADRFDHVILTQDWHPAGHTSFASSHPGKAPFDTVEAAYGPQVLWPDHCVQESRGADFHPRLLRAKAELILRKGFRPAIDSYSAFFENDHATPTGLAGYLRERGINELYLVGLALDFCVGWSAVDGKKQGFEVIVIEDATRAIDTGGSLKSAYDEMRSAGVRMASSEDVLAATSGAVGRG